MKLCLHSTMTIWEEPLSQLGISAQSALLGVGRDLAELFIAGWQERIEYFRPASRQIESTAEKFGRLASQWKKETRLLSSTDDIASHPSYQQIIGLGCESLPFIFDDLRRESSHWFWALSAITGADPVANQDRGNIPRMREAWLTWGRLAGYVAP